MALQSFKLSNFSGLNTVSDSSNQGVASARECKNFILRPLGGLGVPPAWKRFSPGGVDLNLGYFVNIDYKFNAGIRLLLQSQAGSWWDVTPNAYDGRPANVTVAAPATPLVANLVLTAGQIMAFYNAATGYMQLGADDATLDWFTVPLGFVLYSTTVYAADIGFAWGYGPVFTDPNSGTLWKLIATDPDGLAAVTI